MPQFYTSGLHLSTTGVLHASHGAGDNALMVDSPSSKAGGFAAWLQDQLRARGRGAGAALAKELGVTSQHVDKWKNGSRPSASVLKHIADYFGVTYQQLVTMFDRYIEENVAEVRQSYHNVLVGPDGARIGAEWEKLPETQRHAVALIIHGLVAQAVRADRQKDKNGGSGKKTVAATPPR
jgi:transcriptional regulator with XRE-family HTH domain